MHSVMTGAVNGMPALRAVVTANLSSMGFDIAPYVVVTVLRANQTAYILTVATRVQTAAAKQPLIEQIVGTFRPTIQAQTETLPTALPTPASEAAGVVGPGTHLVGIDFAPGVYVRRASEGVLCTWERLNSLREASESIIAVDAHAGLFYVVVLESDLAFATNCELSPIEERSGTRRISEMRFLQACTWWAGTSPPVSTRGRRQPVPPAPGNDLMV